MSMPPPLSPPQLLQALVDMVDALGELAASVAGLDRDVQVAVHGRALHEALGTFTQHLCDSLCHHDVTYLEYHNVTSLGQFLATLGATPVTTWADVRATVRAWWESMEKLARSWWWVDGDATDLLDACGNTGTAKATTEATARPRDCGTRPLRRLGDIELALAETKEASRDVPKALVATVAEAKRLWEASAHLATPAGCPWGHPQPPLESLWQPH
ncbi:hypothetical protein HGM15179_020868 [Zosterops borbonicus]|uniref:Uncharacterized protein n=1 Tax=Zosterops borbonicus TaxID=364589 RepID=A0A8K1D8E5_9PASS|nr:hypothetical protein HGM15179_020868 [Zosterops borbonicus]